MKIKALELALSRHSVRVGRRVSVLVGHAPASAPRVSNWTRGALSRSVAQIPRALDDHCSRPDHENPDSAILL